ncbi:MAG: hypothetical protein AAF938_22365 [Myxococcota bacterium]
MLRLLQVRARGSYAARHEVQCVRRCLDVRTSVHSVFEADLNALVEGTTGFIVGGSGSLSLHDEATRHFEDGLRRFLDAAFERRIPGFLICFGHQFLAHHLGAQVVTDEARKEAGTIHVSVVGRGAEDPLFGPRAPLFFAHAGHSDHVTEVPSGTELLARTPESPIQALKVHGMPVYSTQFHPDLTARDARARYIAAFGEGPVALEAAERFDASADSATSTLIAEWWESARA